MAPATQARVAGPVDPAVTLQSASEDLTGHGTLGGEWDLEYTIGEIETAIAISPEAQRAWAGILVTETVLDNFATQSYSNNHGTQSWNTDWIESLGD